MKLNVIAAALRVHPRTVLRALTREDNPYWAEGYDPVVRVAEVAVAFSCTPNKLRDILREEVPLLTQKEAAAALKMPVRTFRWHGFSPTLQFGNKVHRYTAAELRERAG